MSPLSTATPSTGAHLASLQAAVVAVEDRNNEPPSRPFVPIVRDNPPAVDAYVALGRYDAEHPGADIHTGPSKPLTASWRFVNETAHSPLTALGDWFAQFRTLYREGLLGHRDPEPVPAWRVALAAAPLVGVLILLAVAGIITEVIYGQSASALLTAADPTTALASAIAISLSVNGLAIAAGGWVHKTNPSIVRRGGPRVAAITAFLIAALAGTLGLVIGGYDNLTFATTSGGSATTVNAATPPGRPLVTFTYFVIMVMIAFAMAIGHLLIADTLDTKRIELEVKAKAVANSSSVNETERHDLARAICQDTLSAIQDAQRQARVRVQAYRAAFMQSAASELAEVFDFPDLLADTAPAWADDVVAMLEELDDEPAPATITRIA